MFWIFMLIMDMLIPFTMIFMGKRFIKKPPEKINWGYGYRTTMSMKNKDTWKFAHEYCGKIWCACGKVLLPLSILPLFFVIGGNEDEIGNLGGIICAAQIAVMLASIIPTEAALRRNFDRSGRRKQRG